MNRVERMLRTDDNLTVGQLIEQLLIFDSDQKVLFVCDYGDHSHTQQALPISSVEEEYAGCLEDSPYSQSHVALTEENGHNDCEETVVILR